MRYKNDKKISNLSSPDSFFQAQNAPKSVFGRGSAPDPTGGAYNAPPDPLVGWEGGYPLPIPPSTPRFSGLLNTKSWLRQCHIGYDMDQWRTQDFRMGGVEVPLAPRG